MRKVRPNVRSMAYWEWADMSIDPTKRMPTLEGRDRYPPDGYYDEVPCTCQSDCEFTCKGECNCEACVLAHSDFLARDEFLDE